MSCKVGIHILLACLLNSGLRKQNLALLIARPQADRLSLPTAKAGFGAGYVTAYESQLQSDSQSGRREAEQGCYLDHSPRVDPHKVISAR